MNLQEKLASHGLHPPVVINDGKMRRFHYGIKTGKRNGWIIVHPDGHGGAGVWGTDIKFTFRGDSMKEITPEERREWRAQASQREADQKAAWEKAAIAARALWERGFPASDEHPYLKRKNVHAHGLRMLDGQLLIPMRDETGEIVNVQKIPEDGEKRFTFGGKTKGCYHLWGEIGDEIWIGEGYSTIASVHENTGSACAIAFSAGNLSRVTEILKAKYPSVQLKIAADNDQGKRKYGTDELYNPGLEAALQAAQYGADVYMPEFTPEEGGQKLTDFNDMLQTKGPAAVQQALSKPVRRGIDYRGFLPNTKDKGKPMATVENLEEICKRIGVTIRFNHISRKEEINIPGMQSVSDIADKAYYAKLQSECAKFNFPIGQLDSFISHLASQNAYNPVANWILSREWDGENRKRQLFETVVSRNEVLKESLIYRWCLQAIAAAFEPNGIAAQGVLVFQGAQDIGKTSWMLSLVPEEMRSYVKESVILRLDKSDSVIEAAAFWLVELGELDATFKRSEIAQLKAFITNQKDVVRTPYSKRASEFPRRTVFFASVNPQEFLHDTTGNRRFWTIQCEKINWQHKIDMQQFWREIYEDYRSGERFHLTTEEKRLMNENNLMFESGDPINDRISMGYKWDHMHIANDWKTATDVLMEIGYKTPTNQDCRKAAEFIRKLNGDKQMKKASARLLLMPPRMTNDEPHLEDRIW